MHCCAEANAFLRWRLVILLVKARWYAFVDLAVRRLNHGDESDEEAEAGHGGEGDEVRDEGDGQAEGQAVAGDEGEQYRQKDVRRARCC